MSVIACFATEFRLGVGVSPCFRELAPYVAGSYTPQVMSLLNNCLWITANLLCAVAVGIGFRRKLLSSLPAFFAYMTFCALQTLFFVVTKSGEFNNLVKLYGWFLVVSILAGFFLEIAVIYELWNRLVHSHSFLASIFRPLPRWSAAVLLLLATFIAALLPQNVSFHSLQVYSTLSVALNLLDLSLLIMLSVITRLSAISWGTLPAGVALGIAVSDIGGAVAAALLNHMGPHFFLDTILEGSFALTGALWLISVLCCTESNRVQEFLPISGDDLLNAEQLNRMLRG